MRLSDSAAAKVAVVVLTAVLLIPSVGSPAEKERTKSSKRPVEPEPLPESGYGFLTLNTTPWTKVSVDGQDLGSTPLYKRKLPVGTHKLRLSNEGQAVNVERTVVIEPDTESRFELSLSAAGAAAEDESAKKTRERAVVREPVLGFGFLTLNTVPATQVTVDGKPMGSTPFYNRGLPAGTRKLRLSNPKYNLDVERVVLLRKDKQTKVIFELLKADVEAKTHGTLTLDTLPPSRVSANGVSLGATPLKEKKLKAGKYFLRMTNAEEDVSVELEVVIVAGKGTLLSIPLKW